jgi:hypothetical protein
MHNEDPGWKPSLRGLWWYAAPILGSVMRIRARRKETNGLVELRSVFLGIAAKPGAQAVFDVFDLQPAVLTSLGDAEVASHVAERCFLTSSHGHDVAPGLAPASPGTRQKFVAPTATSPMCSPPKPAATLSPP